MTYDSQVKINCLSKKWETLRSVHTYNYLNHPESPICVLREYRYLFCIQILDDTRQSTTIDFTYLALVEYIVLLSRFRGSRVCG